MKKTTLALLTLATAASMAGIANAVPFGTNNLPPGLSNQGGFPPGLANQGGPPGLSNQGGTPLGLSGESGGNNPLFSFVNTPNTPASAVPEGGPGLLFLGMGMVALLLWRRRSQQRLG